MTRPVVVVSGWLLPARWLDPLVDAVAREQPVRIEALPGQDGRAGGDWTPDSLAATVLAELDGPALWIGWSLGAQVVLAAAARAPERVAGALMIAATPCFCRRPDWPAGRPPAEIRAMRARLARAPDRLAADLGERLCVPVTLPAGLAPERRLALDAGLAALADNDWRATVAGLRQPVHWWAGDRDPLVATDAVRAAAALGAAGRAGVLDGAGHVPFESHRDELLAALAALQEETV